MWVVRRRRFDPAVSAGQNAAKRQAGLSAACSLGTLFRPTALHDKPGVIAMLYFRTFALTMLALGGLAMGLVQWASPAAAQSLEDVLRRAERGTGTPPPSAPPQSGSTLKWGAVAAALWKRQGVVQVAVGSAVRYNSKSEAVSAAIRQCRNAGGPNCKVATTWSTGCGYITTGRNRRGAGWVARASYAETMRDCRNKGYRCKKAIGGCL